MNVYFAMISQDGVRRPAFFVARGSAPDRAIEISEARHAELLEAQAQGRQIGADARGRPIIVRRRRPDAGVLRSRLRAAIRTEAARRIRIISPEWRQINDLRCPSEAGRIRFARIDAIRAAEGEIGALAETCLVNELPAFRIADHPLWPEFDDA